MSIPYPKLLTRDRRSCAKTISGIVVCKDESIGVTKTPKDLPGRAIEKVKVTDFYPYSSDSEDSQFQEGQYGASTLGSKTTSRKTSRVSSKKLSQPVYTEDYDRASDIVSAAPSVRSEKASDSNEVNNSQRRTPLGGLRSPKITRIEDDEMPRSPSVARSLTVQRDQSPMRSPLSRSRSINPIESSKTAVSPKPRAASPMASIRGSNPVSPIESPKTAISSKPRAASPMASIRGSNPVSLIESPKTAVSSKPRAASPMASIRGSNPVSPIESPKTAVSSKPRAASPMASIRGSNPVSPIESPKTAVSPKPRAASPMASIRGSSPTRLLSRGAEQSPMSRLSPLSRANSIQRPQRSPWSSFYTSSSQYGGVKPVSSVASLPPIPEELTETTMINDTSDESVRGEDEALDQAESLAEARVEAIEDMLAAEAEVEESNEMESDEPALRKSPSVRYNEEVVTDPGDYIEDVEGVEDAVDIEDAKDVETPETVVRDISGIADDDSDSESEETVERQDVIENYERSNSNQALEDEMNGLSRPLSLTEKNSVDSVEIQSDDPESLPSPPAFIAKNLPFRPFRNDQEKAYDSLGFTVMRTFHLYQPGTISNAHNYYLVQMSSCFGDIFFVKFNNPVIMGDDEPLRIPLNTRNTKITCPSDSFQQLMRGPDVVTVFVDGIIYNGKIYTTKNDPDIEIVSPYVYPIYIHEDPISFIDLCYNARTSGSLFEDRMKKELENLKDSLVGKLEYLIRIINTHHLQMIDVDNHRLAESDVLYDIFHNDVRRGKLLPKLQDTHRIKHLTETMIRYTTSHMSLWCALSSKIDDVTKLLEETSPHIYSQIATDYPELNVQYADAV